MQERQKKDEKVIKERQKVIEKFNLDAVDSKILQLIMDMPGITNKEIGVFVGLKEKAVCIRRNKEKFRRELQKLTLAPIERLKAALPELTDRYLKYCFYSGEESVGERAISKVLTSFGILKKESQDSETSIVTTTIEHPTEGTKYEVKTEVGPKRAEDSHELPLSTKF